MSLRALLGIVLVFGASSLAGAQDLGGILKQAMKGRSSLPALGVLLIEDGAVKNLAVRGVRAAGSPGQVTTDDVWHIGSDGKAMTATLIAILVERGKLSWDEPLPRLLPGVPMNPGFTTVTLKGLLAHTAGLPHDPPDPWLETATADKGKLHDQRLNYARTILGKAPLFRPAQSMSTPTVVSCWLRSQPKLRRARVTRT